MRKTHLMVLAIVLAVAVLAVGAVGAYADLASDDNPPVTTTDAVASYWDAAADHGHGDRRRRHRLHLPRAG